ncbi:MAG TPA: glycosyltransferase family 39 protein [Acidimicrobiia bacterium]|nr:glycosyltransferase family 39 protein [Acidimicrobiia bacterium]
MAVPAALAAGAVVLRIPAFLAARHVSFDDGVYGASAVAMRTGALPFREVFSSQGPLFLPLVWLADLLGGRTLDAPRLLAVASGVALVLAVWSAARTLALSRPAAIGAAGLVATSGSVLWVTGPLTSDGPGLALAAWAVTAALRYRRTPSLRWALATGALLGAALSIKSLLLGAVPPVAWALWPAAGAGPARPAPADGRWWPLVAALAAAGAVSLLVALPWGLGNVWDQAFRYHLEAAGARTPVRNLRKVASTLGDRDLPRVVAALAAAVTPVLHRRRKGSPSGSPTVRVGHPLGLPLVGAWLGTTGLVLAAEHPLWRNHVAHLIPPAALLVAAVFDRVPRPKAALAAMAVATAVVLPYHLVHDAEVLWPAPPGPALAAAVRDLRALPPGAEVISDDPGVVWRSGRATPPDLVDTSILRIESGRLTAGSLAAAAAGPRVCAVLAWSHRFGDLGGLPDGLRRAGYTAGPRYGGPKVLWRRSCER